MREVKAGTQAASHIISSQEQREMNESLRPAPTELSPDSHVAGTLLPRDGDVHNGLHYRLSRQSPTDIPTGQLDLHNYSTEAPFPVKIMTTACIY